MSRPTQAERKQITKSRLKASALDAFARKGVNSTGVEDIVRGAGYSRGAFYGNYSSKYDLLIDALSDRQLSEVRVWQEIIESASDPKAGLASLASRYEDRSNTVERTMLSVELQLEAERNPNFRPVFMNYLDGLYAEMRKLFVTMLARNGKAPPPDMDSVLITSRLLGLGLGSGTILGAEMSERVNSGSVMMSYLIRVIEAAPPLSNGTNPKK